MAVSLVAHVRSAGIQAPCTWRESENSYWQQVAVEQTDASGAFLHTQRGAGVEVSLTRSLLHKGQDLLVALKARRVRRFLDMLAPAAASHFHT